MPPTASIAAPEDTWAHLSFRLPDEFIAQYVDREVQWGFPMGKGNTLGELTFYSKYSRRKPDGSKEHWYEACRRVIEGMFSIQKDHCTHERIPWNTNKARASAEEAYERMFTMKWLPPGRGIEHMGTPFIFDMGSAALQNCAFVSTKTLSQRNPTKPFIRLMEMSMLGIGVGADVLGAGNLTIHQPTGEPEIYVIEDSREGWCDSQDALLRSYFLPGKAPLEFDYSLIRPEGTPLKRFGGTAAGPEPLMRLHEAMRQLFDGRHGQTLTSTDITDVFNLEGKCVVAGSSRRSAELILGSAHDKEFLNLKNPFGNARRLGFEPNDTGAPELDSKMNWVKHPDGGWGYLSNNSVAVDVGTNLDHLAEPIAISGEPGIVYLDLARQYGRLIDPPNNKDHRVAGVNPCAEQTLEDNECCTLVEVFPTRADDKADFHRTLKFAYLYAKSVTLLSTHWPETNEVMKRNRRIGTSCSGVFQFAEKHDWTELRTWMNQGYAEICRYDVVYSEWLGVRESIKKTSVKPSGTVSLLAGVWPGVHLPVAAGDYLRRVRERATSPIVDFVRAAGYPVEPDVMDPEFTVVFSFPVTGPDGRSQAEAPVWEKAALAALMQRYWADNAVSATFSFLPEEAKEIGNLIRAFEGQLKTLSFLPLDTSTYPQMPYEPIEQYKFDVLRTKVKPFDWKAMYAAGEAPEGEKFCTTDVCELPKR